MSSFSSDVMCLKLQRNDANTRRYKPPFCFQKGSCEDIKNGCQVEFGVIKGRDHEIRLGNSAVEEPANSGMLDVPHTQAQFPSGSRSFSPAVGNAFDLY